jgi:Gas vesicle synthesis protein GvpL/GvpF
VKYLLHCIFGSGADPQPSVPAAGIRMVAAHGLSAVFSCIDESTPALDVGRLMAYETVVAAFHKQRPVIPLRYGCTMESEAAIKRLLEEHREEYQRLLRQLEGMAEMGLRILVGNRQSPSAGEPPSAVPAAPGVTYLAALRKQYVAETSLTQQEQALEMGICKALDGVYAQERREASTINGSRLVSLFFLVPTTSIAWFVKRIEAFQSWNAARFLVSGPWPPYNFV